MQVYFMASSILQESIEEINKEFPDEWNETISLIKKLCAKEGVELSIFNAIQGKGIFLEEKHKEYAIEYLNKELRQAKVEGYYDEMNFAIIIHQKTGIISNSGVKNPSKKVQNICIYGCIKHGSDFSCVCDAGHTVQST